MDVVGVVGFVFGILDALTGEKRERVAWQTHQAPERGDGGKWCGPRRDHAGRKLVDSAAPVALVRRERRTASRKRKD